MIQVLAGLASLSQTVGAVLRTTWPGKPTIKIEQNVSLVNSLHWKNHSTTFDKMHGKVKNSTNLSTTKIETLKVETSNRCQGYKTH